MKIVEKRQSYSDFNNKLTGKNFTCNHWINTMDPITSFAVGHLTGKIIDRLGTSFYMNVVERWSKHRSKCFFEQFCHEVEIELAGGHSANLEHLLEKFLTDDHSSEVLFDAYRRVSLSRSKNIGPRVVAVVTAKLIVEQRMANEVEQSILDASEQLYDSELLDFAAFVSKSREEVNNKKDKSTLSERGILRVRMGSEQIDSNSPRKSDIPVGPLNLHESLGSWAPKLEVLGIIESGITESNWGYEEDSERHIDQDGSVREIAWWIYMSDVYFSFAEMIDRLNFSESSKNSPPPQSS